MSGKETIAAITGISPKVQDEIWEQVKANQLKLSGCARPHDFSICIERRTNEVVTNPTPGQTFGAKWQCSKCSGRVDHHAKHWYTLGFQDGKL